MRTVLLYALGILICGYLLLRAYVLGCGINMWIPGRSDLSCGQYKTLSSMVFVAQTVRQAFELERGQSKRCTQPEATRLLTGKASKWVSFSREFLDPIHPCWSLQQNLRNIESHRLDGWGKEFHYQVVVGTPSDVRFHSAGPDGLWETRDDFVWRGSEKYTTEDGYRGEINPWDGFTF